MPEEYWWDKHKRMMDSNMPPPSCLGALLANGCLAAPIVGSVFFGETGVFVGLVIGAILGLVLFSMRRQ